LNKGDETVSLVLVTVVMPWQNCTWIKVKDRELMSQGKL